MSQTLYGQLVERFKRRLIRLALKKTGGNMARAGRLLKMCRQDLSALAKHFGIDPGAFRKGKP